MATTIAAIVTSSLLTIVVLPRRCGAQIRDEAFEHERRVVRRKARHITRGEGLGAR
jgi:hypothetical protein